MEYVNFNEAKRFYLAQTCESMRKFYPSRSLELTREVKDPYREVSYKTVFKDLYVSYLEDEGDNRDYWVQVQEAKDRMQKFSEDELEDLIEGVFETRYSKKGTGLKLWQTELGLEKPKEEEDLPREKVNFIIRSKEEKRGGKGKRKARHMYLLPDGTVRELPPSAIGRYYTSKGISVTRLD